MKGLTPSVIGSMNYCRGQVIIKGSLVGQGKWPRGMTKFGIERARWIRAERRGISKCI